MRMVFPNQMTGRFIDELATDMNTLVNTLFGENAKDCCGEGDCDPAGETTRWTRPMDVFENDAEYRLIVDLPGVSLENIEVDVEEDSVSISAHRDHGEPADGDQLVRQERRFGRFQRQVSLPKNVDPDAVSAEYADGVLTLVLPKVVEKAASRRVQVNQGK